MAESYEHEIMLLKERLENAEDRATKERARREQLEEDIKRMLLKNLTTMNIETLSVFQQSLLGENALPGMDINAR
jgi:hypothetical protein